MKIIAIVQARMGSERLPGKVMLEIGGKSILSHVIARLKQSRFIDEIVIATTIDRKDDVIVEETKGLGIKFFRGSVENVLLRYYYAALENNADIIIRITSDCPLIDPKVIDKVITIYKENEYEIVANASSDSSERTFPRGLDVEVFSFKQLEKAYINAIEDYQKEHVTPYIYENTNNLYIYKNNIDYSKHRWTLDTEEDFELICKIYDELYKGTHDFYLCDIIELFENKPELYKINAHIEQKKLKNEE